MNLNERRPGQKPRAPTGHRTAYPVAPKQNHGGRKPNVSTRSISQTQNTEDTLKTSIVASPPLFRAWRFRVPSVHPRDPESDSFLACAAEKKRGWQRRARHDVCLRSRLFSSVFVSWALRDVRRYSNFINI